MAISTGYSISVNCDHVYSDGSCCSEWTEFGGSELKSIVWKGVKKSKWLINKQERTAYCPRHRTLYEKIK